MSTDKYGWIWGILCPILGVFLSNMMALTPVSAVLEARRQKDLGQLDPIPLALLMNAQLGWTIYAVYRKDIYVFFSNSFPFMVGNVLCLTAIHILERAPQHEKKEETTRIRIESVMLMTMCYWMFVIMVTCFAISDENRDSSIMIIGLSADAASLVYYASPLAGIWEIIKTKDSSSLYVPSIVISSLNCLLWTIYGLFGVNQLLLWLPNAIGFAICMIGLILSMIYPKTDKSFGEAFVEASAHELVGLTSGIKTNSTEGSTFAQAVLDEKYIDVSNI
jgi:solute carrier family 50 protein (sugar transporter)